MYGSPGAVVGLQRARRNGRIAAVVIVRAGKRQNAGTALGQALEPITAVDYGTAVGRAGVVAAHGDGRITIAEVADRAAGARKTTELEDKTIDLQYAAVHNGAAGEPEGKAALLPATSTLGPAVPPTETAANELLPLAGCNVKVPLLTLPVPYSKAWAPLMLPVITAAASPESGSTSTAASAARTTELFHVAGVETVPSMRSAPLRRRRRPSRYPPA